MVSFNVPDQLQQKLDTYDIIIVVVFALIFIGGVIGNSIVIYLFRFKSNKKRSIMEDMIIYLAVVDLLVSIFAPALFIYWTITFETEWHFGYIGCKILPAFSRVGITMSTGIILIMAIERCRALSQPFKERYTRRTINVALFITFMLSLATESPYTIYEDVIKNSTCELPTSLRTEGVIAGLCIYSLRDIICIAVFVISFYRIYTVLYDKESLLCLREQKSFTKKKKIFKLLVTMATVFMIFMLPRDIYHIVLVLSFWTSPPGIPWNETAMDVNSFLKMLQTCNSIANVFIYAHLHGSFRKRLLNKPENRYEANDTEDGIISCKDTQLENLETLFGYREKENTKILEEEETLEV